LILEFAFYEEIALIDIPAKQHDVAEVIYPGDRARQSSFRDKVAFEIIGNNQGLTYKSP
jgi:hypothetical protein